MERGESAREELVRYSEEHEKRGALDQQRTATE